MIKLVGAYYTLRRSCPPSCPSRWPKSAFSKLTLKFDSLSSPPSSSAPRGWASPLVAEIEGGLDLGMPGGWREANGWKVEMSKSLRDVNEFLGQDWVELILSRISQAASSCGRDIQGEFQAGDFLCPDPSPPEGCDGRGGGFVASLCNPPYGLYSSRGLPYAFMDKLLSFYRPDYVVAVLPRRMRGYVGAGYEVSVVGETEEFEGRGGKKVKQPSVVVEFVLIRGGGDL
ncbi:hypothetical protein TrRE_jg8491 [Triparma retinervis]|uniref:Uncharacterized protein n=1 Tax=Triparma retinervis TaxID=2557542 RepID=A0A9W6ZH19_9STRA|nr:hypothetical protein TrRE_jg8491 [Triparma retinervis]